MFMNTILKEKRKELSLTQEKLAELLGISLMTVRRWEWGETSPNANILPKLAEVLQTTPECLLGENDIGDTVHVNVNQKDRMSSSVDSYEIPYNSDENLGYGREFFYECNGQKVRIPAKKDFTELFLRMVREMRSSIPVMTVNNNASAYDNAQAMALGDNVLNVAGAV